MKKDVHILIKATQMLDGDSDRIETTTNGHLYNKDGKYYISYTEGEDTGLEKSSATLKISPDGKLAMMRRGQTDTHLVFEKGRCHTGNYKTPYGNFAVSVTTNNLDIQIDENGGNIDIDYIMNINDIAKSHNTISLTLRA